jgi:hypothetical protein
MPAQLITEQGATSATAYLLSEGVTTSLGRNPNNSLVLTDRHVSRWHATISSAGGRFFLRDQSSVNGTRVDGRLIECETPLHHGQVIRVGGVILRYDHPAARPIQLDPAWLTGNDRAVIHLAATIAGEGSFELMPILADALEDAGCADADVLRHCREGGPHRRGCWVLELIVPSHPTPSLTTDSHQRLDSRISMG